MTEIMTEPPLRSERLPLLRKEGMNNSPLGKSQTFSNIKRVNHSASGQALTATVSKLMCGLGLALTAATD